MPDDKNACPESNPYWKCLNLKETEASKTDFNGESYFCEKCKRHMYLDYDEMR